MWVLFWKDIFWKMGEMIQSPRVSLPQVVKWATATEKQFGSLKMYVVYRVYENDELVYVGIGGKGNRKGSGRLKEHMSDSLFSSFRFQYMVLHCIRDLEWGFYEAQERWENLQWEIEYYWDFNSCDERETMLINEFDPVFNRDKKKSKCISV